MKYDIKEFVELVRSLRITQKNYFKDRTMSTMQRAKAVEHQVDVWLHEWDRKQREETLNLEFWNDASAERLR